MAETNFRIFNEENAADKTYNDSEYEQATQRLGGVTPGMALSRLHNKLYLQTSVMAKAIADFLVKQGYDCYDNQATDITANLENAIKSFNASVVAESITAHNADTDAHKDFVGATAEKEGARGMVPAPAAGDESKVLTGGKVWSLIEELNVALGNIAAPTADTAVLKTLLGGMAYMFKSITGKEDWKELPEASIADILTNLQGSLAVNWDGNKFTVPALGVSGLMEQNGYINLGKLFGGLIVQWGKDTSPGRHATRQYMLPLAVSINLVVMLTAANASLGASDSDPGDVAGDFAVTVKDSTSFTVYQNYIQLSNLMWLAIGFCRPSCVTTNT